MIPARYSSIVSRIVALAPMHLTLLEVCRRVRGRGVDRLRVNVVGRVILVAPEFGAAIENLAFSGVIRLEGGRGLRVLPGRNYKAFRLSAAQRSATATRFLGASVPPNSSATKGNGQGPLR